MKAELSERQRQILELAADGRTDREIAELTRLSEGTVRTYWDRMRRRFAARSRAEVVAKALMRSDMEVARYTLIKLPLFIWTADPSGYVDFCNEWFFTRGGLNKEDSLGVGCRALMPESELAASADRWEEAQRTNQGYEAIVHFYCGPERELREHKIRLTPLLSISGECIKWIGYGREMAENADEQMARFLKTIFELAHV